MPPKVEFEQIDEHGSMVHSVISCSLRFHGKGCCDPSTIGDYTLSFNRLYFLSCTVVIELHEGDPSRMTAAEIEDSYQEPGGMMTLCMSWRGEATALRQEEERKCHEETRHAQQADPPAGVSLLRNLLS